MTCNSSSLTQIIGAGVYVLLEFYLGRTGRTRVSSVLEGLIVVFGSLIVIIVMKLKPKGENKNV
jgi:hypothetical protein